MGYFPTQDAGKPTNPLAEKWRKSCLNGPQTAGIPTSANEDGVGNLDNWEDSKSPDLTGGVMDYHRKQSKKSK